MQTYTRPRGAGKYPYFKEVYGSESSVVALVIKVSDPERWNQFLDAEPLFLEGMLNLFKQGVVETHKYLIRVTPFDTGRLRGGWTSYLDKKRIDYSMVFMDLSLVDVRSFTNSAEAIQEGKAMSSFLESETQVTLTNEVPYGQYVEFGTSRMQGRYFTRKAVYKAESIFSKSMEAWLKEMAATGDICLPKPTVEGAAV